MSRRLVLSYIESGVSGYYHAASTTLRPLDRVQERFFRELGLSSAYALERYNLALVEIQQLLLSKETTRTKNRLQAPTGFSSKNRDTRAHAQLDVESDTQKREIVSESVRAVEDVERLLAGIELHAVCLAPFVKTGLASATLSQNFASVRRPRERFPAIIIVGEDDLDEAQ